MLHDELKEEAEHLLMIQKEIDRTHEPALLAPYQVQHFPWPKVNVTI